MKEKYSEPSMVKIELFKDDVVRTSDPTVIPGGGSPDNPTTDPNE